MKKLVCIASLAILAPLANAQPQVAPYQYGQDLDIAKVVSVKVPPGGCEIVEANMTYLDSQGETHVMSYLRQAEDCHDY